ncbi:glycosyltransferase [Halomonas sp. HK25]|uniref:glycosyltransferase n=1 Tax=Halomonas sp. HK25 TaxID=3394321 RepID=UPI0039FBD877
MIKSLFSRMKLGKQDPERLRGHLDYFEQGIVGGWAGKPSRSSSTKLEVLIDGKVITTINTSGARKDLAAEGFPERNNCGFTKKIDVYPYLNAKADKASKLRVRFEETGAELSKSPLELPKPDIRYHIDRVDPAGIQGWMYDANYLELDLALDMHIDGKQVARIEIDQERHDMVAAGHPKPRCGFYFPHTDYLDPAQFGFITATIAGTDIPVFSKPLIVEPLGAKISALTDLAKAIRELAGQTPDRRHEWLLRDLLPKMIEDARRTRGTSLPNGYTGRHIRLGDKQPTGMVDVVIPVYGGYEETLACIDSALKAKVKTEHRLVVINDKSPNEKLTKALRTHAGQHGYTLLENEHNLGFVGTVNRGMRLHNNADVVLLNSDTLVPDSWLDTIVAAAYSDPLIATVTPFSNNATICSYPNFCQDNQLPDGATANDMNRVFGKVNAGKTIDLPTAHGFCMFIKRAALQEVGVFDDEKWGKGYGEENDFSLRVEQHGWRNVMALDTFVQHLGSVSFAENADQFIANNLEVLNGLYPDYAENVAAFVKQDPVRPYRNAVALEQLKREVATAKVQAPAKGKTMLFVSLTFGGGTQVATDDLASLLKDEGQCVLMLTSPKKGVWKLSSHVSNAHVDYAWPGEKEQLVKDLKALDVWHVHYHHTIEFPKDIWELPKALGVQYDVTIHDYFTICPRANLIDETGVYCGEPPVAACNKCIKDNGTHLGLLLDISSFNHDVAEWRRFYHEKLDQARAVICPTSDVSDRLSRFVSLKNIQVRPHPEEPYKIKLSPLPKDQNINVAFIGAIGKHKGFDVLVDIAAHAEKFQLPIQFTVIGYTENDETISQFSNVTVLGKYEKEELPDIIEKSGCHATAIMSVCPETFGYVLSESLRNGLVPFSFDLGSPAVRLREVLSEDLVIPLSSTAQVINQFIVEGLPRIVDKINQTKDDSGCIAHVDSGFYSDRLKKYYSFKVS